VREAEPISSSLKFCLVAEGKYDLYANFSRMFLWDVAAGHAIMQAAGGRILKKDGSILEYLPGSLKNPHFVAFSKGIKDEFIREKLNAMQQP